MRQSTATLHGLWRDLKCIKCGNIDVFTNANLMDIMAKDYVMHYWCDVCDQHETKEFTGATYELIDGQKIYNQLPFET